MRPCPACGGVLDNRVEVCPHCGTSLRRNHPAIHAVDGGPGMLEPEKRTRFLANVIWIPLLAAILAGLLGHYFWGPIGLTAGLLAGVLVFAVGAFRERE